MGDDTKVWLALIALAAIFIIFIIGSGALIYGSYASERNAAAIRELLKESE